MNEGQKRNLANLCYPVGNLRTIVFILQRRRTIPNVLYIMLCKFNFSDFYSKQLNCTFHDYNKDYKNGIHSIIIINITKMVSI